MRQKFQIILVSGVAALLFVAVGSTGWFAFYNGQAAVEDISLKLRNEITFRIKKDISAYLDLHHQIVEFNSEGITTLNALVDMQRSFWRQLLAFPHTTVFFAANEKREFAGVERWRDGNLMLTASSAATNYTFTAYSASKDGKPQDIIRTQPDYDPRERPWYPIARAANGKLVWSDIYPFPMNHALYVAVAKGIYDEDRQFQGVIAAAVNLDRISQFLQERQIGVGGRTFLLDSSGALVGASHEEVLFTDQEPYRRIQGFASKDPIVQAASQTIMREIENISKLIETNIFYFTQNGKGYYLQVAPFSLGDNLKWLIAVVVAENEFIAPIAAQARITLALCVLAALVASGLGMAIAQSMTRPLRQLARAAEQLAAGDLKQRVDIRWPLELSVLGTAFNVMSDRLHDSFAALKAANLVLEEKVHERTRELEKRNRQLAREVEERKSAQDKAIRRNEKLQFLQRIADIGLTSDAADEALRQAACVIQKATGFPMVAIEILDAERQVMIFRGMVGFAADEQDAILEIPVQQTLSGIVVRTKRPLIEMAAHERSEYAHTQLRKLGVRTFVCLPMIMRGRVIGVVSHGHSQSIAVDDRLVDWCTALANQVALLAERKMVQDRIRTDEERFRAYFDLGLTGMAITSPEKSWVQFNDELCRIFGYSRTELLRLTWVDITHPEDIGADMEQFARIIKGKSEGYALEKRFIRKDGSIVHASVSVRCLRQPDGTVKQFVSLIHDISARVRAENERKMLLDDLKRSNEELQQFAYVASHDLQEPIRMVTNYLQLLQRRYRDKLDQRAEEYINYAVSGAQRMSLLIRDLLEYARVETNHAQHENVDVANVMQEVLEILQLATNETQARLICGPLPIVYADRGQLQRLLQNLVGNALKYRHPERPPEVQINAQRNGAMWVFTVRDNGIGIAEPFYEQIFLLFQRLHTGKAYSGTGIGLAVCKKIVERHGGTIWVESQEGEGSAFHFTLPAAQ